MVTRSGTELQVTAAAPWLPAFSSCSSFSSSHSVRGLSGRFLTLSRVGGRLLLGLDGYVKQVGLQASSALEVPVSCAWW